MTSAAPGYGPNGINGDLKLNIDLGLLVMVVVNHLLLANELED